MSSNWKLAKLSDLCTRISDGTHHSPEVQHNEPGNGRFKYITSKNIRPWGLDLNDIAYVDESVHREIFTRCKPELGDVLLTKDGANTGNVAINTLEEEFSLLSSVALLKPKREILEPRFLRYFLESPVGAKRLLGKMTGTAIRRVILKKIKDTEIQTPPLPEQRRIVAEIEKQFTRLEAGVNALKRVQANLKRYRAAVLKAACEGRLVPTEAELAKEKGKKKKKETKGAAASSSFILHPSSLYESGSELLSRILAERRKNWQGRGQYKEPASPDTANLGPLPEGWIWTGFEQLADGTKNAIKAGPFGSALKKSFYKPLGFKIYGQEQVIKGDPYFGNYFISRELFEQLRSCEVKSGDILISLVGTTGKVLILPDDCAPGIINPRLLKLSLNRTGVSAKFIKFLLESVTTRAFFKLAAHGGTMDVLNLGILKTLPIPLPPLAEQTRIVAEVERRLSVVEELEATVSANLQRAIRLRQAVLQKAFKGEIVK